MSRALPPITGRFRGKRVALLVGGLSSEREVSFQTGAAMAEALRTRGYDVVEIDARRDLALKLRASGAAVVFSALHGTFAEDGRIQGLLDWVGLPYTGSDARASLLAFDKVLAKRLFRAAGLPVAEDRVWTGGELDLPLPVVVKPAAEGSSVGVTIAAERGEVLVERFIDGPEISVTIYDGQALGTVEIEPLRAFYDYDAKYADDAGTHYHMPPRVDPEVVAQAERDAERAHAALGCSGVSRVDFIVGDGQAVLLEVNTLPGMTSHSLVPKVAEGLGVGFPELCERILDLAIDPPPAEDERVTDVYRASPGGTDGA
jgi:D-alanine-D-alanine ligase